MLSVAIVGRPNVGKSTLFNRLVGKRIALVGDQPGVTRDRREGEGQLADLEFRVVDTAGYEDVAEARFEAAVRAQTERAIEIADVILMVVDVRAGITPVDESFADLLRRAGKPVVLVANKAEGRAGMSGAWEGFELGLGQPIPISAEHGEGMADLYDALRAAMDESGAAPGGEKPAAEDVGYAEELDDARLEEDEGPGTLQLAIVGRPNVGKSTLLNRLVEEERVLTGPEPGVTRDAIAVDWQWSGRPVRLIDTAGLRRQARVADRVERLSVEDTRRAIRFAHVVVLVIDATLGLERQDLTIARDVAEEGRALVLAINKWDLVDNPSAAMRRIRDRLETSLPQIRGVPVVTLSALTGLRVERLMEAVWRIYDIWNVRISTGELNRWLMERTEQNPPPVGAGGKRIRLRYMTQVKRRPPTFVLFSPRAPELSASYVRYLVNALRDDFGLTGVPIRFNLRKGRNPYAGAG